MLDAVEASIRDMFRQAAARACAVAPEMAHVVGEVAAEDWYRRCLPAELSERAVWLRGAVAVLPLIPARSPDPACFGISGSRAVQAARNMVALMHLQMLRRCPPRGQAVDLTQVRSEPSSRGPRGAYCRR